MRNLQILQEFLPKKRNIKKSMRGRKERLYRLRKKRRGKIPILHNGLMVRLIGRSSVQIAETDL